MPAGSKKRLKPTRLSTPRQRTPPQRGSNPVTKHQQSSSQRPPTLLPAGAQDLVPAGRATVGWGVHRVVGLETEYGIHAPTQPGASHAALSFDVVNAYAQKLQDDHVPVAGTEWDYGEESPLMDARGWRIPVTEAHPTQLTNQPLNDAEGKPIHQLVNTLLPNGARFYVDHAHPEYSSPETTNPWQAMIYDQAGDLIIGSAVAYLNAHSHRAAVQIYKNNTDGKLASYGAHENYLVDRGLNFEELTARLLPFFVARQVITGSGRVGIGISDRRAGFQLSQRADFFEEEVGIETTIHRPIVNTRDEPHATASSYRRLHVIIGDANLSQWATWMRVGMTSLVLHMIELGTAPALELADPVAALQTISHDPSLQATVTVNGAGQYTGLDLLERYLEAAEDHVQRFQITDEQTRQVLYEWRTAVDGLRTDPYQFSDRIEWLGKYRLLDAMRARTATGRWDEAKLAMMDLQWADIRPDKGLYHALVARGSIRQLVDDTVVHRAVMHPPEDTRAYTRGRSIGIFGAHLAGVSWDNLVFRPYHEGRLYRLDLREPLAGSKAEIRHLQELSTGAPVGEDTEIFRPGREPVPATPSPQTNQALTEVLTVLSRYHNGPRSQRSTRYDR
ncbi:proteasome accessory factor PafA2 [Auritidibacter sp. NML130574]|nr:proteasome accessory factor PafA2 [Auritidibacter sp. NML130574]